MSDKKTRAELLQMLAEAVRNTQPQPAPDTQTERHAQSEPKQKARPAPKRTTKIKSTRVSAGRKSRRRK